MTGGIALMFAGLPMMLKPDQSEPDGDDETRETSENSQDWHSVAVVPMTFPMSIGGIILVTIAVQLLASGLKGLFAILAG